MYLHTNFFEIIFVDNCWFATNCYQLQTNWHSCTYGDLNIKISNSSKKFRVSCTINTRHFWCIMICYIIDWLTVLSWTEIKFFKLICTAKRIRGRSMAIVSSIKSKFDDQLFAIYVFCTSFKPEIVFVLICRAGRTILGSQFVQNT